MPHRLAPAAKTIPCPAHDTTLTPDEARELASQLLALADTAEGCVGMHQPVTRWDVLLELAVLRDRVHAIAIEREIDLA